VRLLIATIALLLSSASYGADPEALPSEPSLEEIRAATEKYKDVKVAERDGYVRDPMGRCVTANMIGYPAAAGAMGVHYLRKDLLGITGTKPRVDGTGTHTDFRTPALLLYEPKADGSLELIGVENMVFEKAWLAGHKERPSYRGVPYNLMADDPATPIDEAHKYMPHFDRHIWLYRENPNGVFEPFNPNVTCAAYSAQQGQRPEHSAH
jgi:hypothetical protein